MALTKVTGQVINTSTDVTVGVLTVTNTLAVGGTVSIGGTLTYEDVTNIDSVGLITARNGIIVGSGITLSKDGDVFATGVTTATTFVGALTGNVTGNVTGNISGGTVAGSTGTFTGDVDIADKIVHTGDTNTAIRFPAADTVTVETAGVERLRVEADGNVNIGAGSGNQSSLAPVLQLHKASSSATSYLHITNTDSGVTNNDGFVIGFNGSNDALLFNKESTPLRFATSGSEAMRIDSSGRLLVGTTAGWGSNVKLHLANSTNTYLTITSGTSHNGVIAFSDDGSERASIDYDHDGDFMVFKTNGNTGERLRIDSSGNFMIGATSASGKLHVEDSGEILAYIIGNTSSAGSRLVLQNKNTTANSHAGVLGADAGGQTTAQLLFYSADNDNNEGYLTLETRPSGGIPVERLRIASNGQVRIGDGTASDYSISNDVNAVLQLTAAATPKAVFIRNDTSIASGDYLGLIDFHSRDGGPVRCARIGAIASGTHASNDNPTDLIFRTCPDGSASDAERIRITSEGKIGINNNDPSAEIELTFDSGTTAPTSGTAPKGIALSYGGTNGHNAGIWFSSEFGGDQGICGMSGRRTSGYDTELRFYTNSVGSARAFSERVRISDHGKLRVGADLDQDAAGNFQVVEGSGSGQTNDCNAYFETNASDWNIKTYYNRTGVHYHLVFIEQGSERGKIQGNDGSNVQFIEGSDYRWKENIVDLTNDEGLEICKKLKPRKYNWIENREVTGKINTVDGFIAHEVEEAGVLGAVVGEKDAVKEDGSIDGQMLDYGQMTPVLSAAIKGLIEKVETLEAEVAALKSN